MFKDFHMNVLNMVSSDLSQLEVPQTHHQPLCAHSHIRGQISPKCTFELLMWIRRSPTTTGLILQHLFY